jgi:ComF family protein
MNGNPRSLWQFARRGAAACARGIGELVFPWRCEICESACQGGPFCPECRADLVESVAKYAATACPRCGMPTGPYANLQAGCSTCRLRRFRFDAAVALGTYDGPLREVCLRLKHENAAWLAPRLGGLLAELRLQGNAAAIIPPDAWVVPVPLHWRRRWRRRYNQAEALAQGIGDRLGLRVRRSLRRVVATPQLAGSGFAPTERFRVMRGAFRVRRDPGIEGRVILLVDDILTTGATSSEAARVLKKAGASRVICAVVARTEGRRS